MWSQSDVFQGFKTNCQVVYLWSGVPQPYNRVNPTGCKEAVAGVGLQAVNDGFIPLQDPHQICCLFLPDEEGAVVWTTNNVLAFAVHIGKKQKILSLFGI